MPDAGAKGNELFLPAVNETYTTATAPPEGAAGDGKGGTDA
jgi:hypothetical protein